MNYALAKQLKEAGFKQEGYGGYWKPPYSRDAEYVSPTINKCHDEPEYSTAVYYLPERVRFVYVPTLSELIEACGEQFGKLIKSRNELGEWYWTAKQRHRKVYVNGTTMEEAVAKLWLRLNKK